MLRRYARRLAWYLQYVAKARTRHGVHSPFVYTLADSVLPHQHSDTARVPELWQSASPRIRRTAALLKRLVIHLQPQRCLMMGARLGFGTLYPAAALSPQATLTVLEDNAALITEAKELMALAKKSLNITCNIDVVSRSLHTALAGLAPKSLDYVFMDGHHTEADTLAYAETILSALADGGLLVLDDIYRNAFMRHAWRTLCAKPEVSVSIDLFHLGLCFVRRPQQKEHFVLWW